MPSWWGKSSSKETKKKTNDETFLDSLRRKLRSPSDVKSSSGSGESRRRGNDLFSDRVSKSRGVSRSASPIKESKHVGRCQSFAERPLAQPLPLPNLQPRNIGRTDSGISVTLKPRVEKNSKSSLFLPLPRPSCIRNRGDNVELEGDLVTASVSSVSSLESDLTDSRLRSPQASDIDIGPRTAAGSPRAVVKDQTVQFSKVTHTDTREPQRGVNNNVLSNQSYNPSQRRPLRNHVPNLQVPCNNGAFYSAPDSSMSSPSRSPKRAEQIINAAAFWATKPYPDVTLLGSGHCSSPGSGHNSGHNSMGGEPLFWQPSRGSPEYSPIPSPRMASPGPGSRVQSGAVTPIHPRAGGSGVVDMHSSWGDEGKQQQSHRLPLPPITIPSCCPFSHGNSAATSPSVPRSPTRGENPPSPGSRWKKGRLLGRGTFGHVYLGFNRETGEMCAMKEVTLFYDDPKSKESAKQLGQEIVLLSRLSHPNIVQYYGSETVGDRLYIYLEFVSGGSIYKLLQEYGQLGEQAIRSYTQQILSGLAYLHGKNTVHRDIKGANILVDPNGRVKLADFGMAKHITGQSCPLSFKGSPYWMAPEVIKNSNGCNLAVDIWSLGCTVLEMATTKPPWSQYEGVAAMFKIGNSKELPTIPEHLSEEGKEFVSLCLQRNPQHRPTAAQLLDHPFVKNAAPSERVERPLLVSDPIDPPSRITNGTRTLGRGLERNLSGMELDRLAVRSSKASPTRPRPSEFHIQWNISCPVSPIGSPLLHQRSHQQLSGMMSPSPISSPRATSGSSTPLTGGGGGSGAIPFHQSQHSTYMQEGFGTIIPRSPNNVFLNGTCHNPNMNAPLRHIQSSPRTLSALVVSSEKDNQVKTPPLRPGPGDLCKGRSELVDRVSQQLLRDQVTLNPSVGLSPRSPLPNRTIGL